jgi:hypothetical protein
MSKTKEGRYYVGIEVLTAVVTKSIIFWDITPRSPLSVTDVSEEHIASIFRVEKYAEEETSVNACGKQTAFTLVSC